MKNLLAMFIAGVAVVSCQNPASNSDVPAVNKQIDAPKAQTTIAKDIDVATFASMIHDKQGQIVDVRTPEEWNDGMIQAAISINYYAPDFLQQLDELDRNQPVYVYCAAGGRSSKAMEDMHKMGFKEVYNLTGGMGAWKMAQQPVHMPN
jgi:phage shock protein E